MPESAAEARLEPAGSSEGARDSALRARRILEHLGVIAAEADSLARNGVERADLVQEGCIAIIAVLDRFDARREPHLAGRVVNQARTRMLRAIRRHRAARRGVLPLSPVHGARLNDPFAIVGSEELRSELDRALATLSSFDRAVLEYRFGLRGGKTHTLREVSRILGSNIQNVLRREYMALSHLRRRARPLLALLRAQ